MERLKFAGYTNTGQDCTASCRVLAGAGIYDDLLSELVPAVESIKIGDIYDETVEMGPLVSEEQRESVAGFVDRAQESGAEGPDRRRADRRRRAYYRPTVVADVDQKAEIVQQEVFGPVVTVQRFTDEDQAVSWANDVDYGLASSVWTKDAAARCAMARRLQFGCVWVNTHFMISPEMPHGGYKQSGYGKDMSMYSLEDYTQIKHVMWSLDCGTEDAVSRLGRADLRRSDRGGGNPMTEIRPFLVNGEWRTGEGTFEVKSPFDDSVVAELGVPTAADVEEAVAGRGRHVPGGLAAAGTRARRGARPHLAAPGRGRREERRADRPRGRQAAQVGDGRGDARVVDVPLGLRGPAPRRRRGDAARHRGRRLAGRIGILRRFPYGPVLGITPFNFPLNLVAHKVAPSLAVGAPIVVKPASATPIGSLALAEYFAETDLPKGMYQVLPVNSKVADGMARDERFRKISFTGSAAIGWYLKSLDPKKRVTLELGGNAGVIVHGDADLDLAAQRVAFGGYYQAGQSCISVQRDPGPVRGLRRLRGPAHQAGREPEDGRPDGSDGRRRARDQPGRGRPHRGVGRGGGRRRAPRSSPAARPRGRSTTRRSSAQTTPEMKVRCEEVFGPVATISPYETFEDALAEVNNSKYGLQAGVFTNDINRAFEAHRTLEVGGVIINDVSAFRADQMPYGGSKDSGFGREGLRFAMEEMTEPRIMVLSHVPL